MSKLRDKELQIAKYQKPLQNSEGKIAGVRCLLCPHFCYLKEGESGLCKSREVKDGKLYSSAYNNPVALAIDRVEKKPLYHFLRGSKTLSLATAGCNLTCLNCQNSHIATKAPYQLPTYKLTAKELVRLAIESETPSISYTYTEPTIFYEYMVEIAIEAREKGIKNIIVSNGYINREPLLELIPLIDAANIDLKSFDPIIHKELTGGELEPILDSIKLLKEGGIHLELTHLMIPTYSDNLKTFEEMVTWLVKSGFKESPLHISRFFPKHKLSHLTPTPKEVIIEAVKIAERAGIDYVYPGNIFF